MTLPNIPPPSGYGPWTVMLAVNIHPKPAKKTEIILHTYCELVLHVMNQQPRSRWVPIIMCGPFQSWRDAIIFKDEWERPTRNVRNRIDRGWDLFQTYCHGHELIFWWQPLYKRDYTNTTNHNITTATSSLINTRTMHVTHPNEFGRSHNRNCDSVHPRYDTNRISVGRIFQLEDKRRRVEHAKKQNH